jgi:hypothetical protein
MSKGNFGNSVQAKSDLFTLFRESPAVQQQAINSRALATLLGPLIPKVGETSLSTERSLFTFAKINLFFVCNHYLNWKLIITYLDNFM